MRARHLVTAVAALTGASLLVVSACSSDGRADERADAPTASTSTTRATTAFGRDEHLLDLAGCHDGCTITGRIPVDHPTLGRLEIVTFGSTPEEPSNVTTTKLLLAVDRDGQVVWDPGSLPPDEYLYTFGPARSSQYVDAPAAGPVDRAGRVFLYWDPGRYNGVSILVPTVDGFDDLDTLPQPDYTAARFYDAAATDADGDGTYEITDGLSPCYDWSCAGGPSWSTRFAWDGSDMVPVPERTTTPCGPLDVWSEQPEPRQLAELDDITVVDTTCHEVMGTDSRFAPPDQPIVERLFRAHLANQGALRIEADGWRCLLTPAPADRIAFRCSGPSVGTLAFISDPHVDDGTGSSG